MVKSSLLVLTTVVVILVFHAAATEAAVEDVEIFRDIVKSANSFVDSFLSRIGKVGSNIKIDVELDNEDEEPDILEIEVDIYEKLGLSEVEIESNGGGRKEKFVLTSVDRNEILEMLAQRLDLSVREVVNLTEFDLEDEYDQGKEAFRRIDRASNEIEKAKWKIGREMERGRNILVASRILNEAIEVFGGIQDTLASKDFKAASQLAQKAKTLASKARDVRNFKKTDAPKNDDKKGYTEKSEVGIGDGSRNFN